MREERFPNRRRKNGAWILVVDDDRGILNVIRKALEKKDIRRCSGRSEKLDFRRLNDYQLILLDVMMPRTDGFSFVPENP